MNCAYAEVSVFENKGIDELVHLVIEKCIELEKQLIGFSLSAIEKQKTAGGNSFRSDSSSFTMHTTASSVPDV